MLAPIAMAAMAAAGQGSLPFLSPVFTDHMVLQRGRPNTFWGWTTPGSEVFVQVNATRARGVADATGKWTVRFNPPPVGGPYLVAVIGPQKVQLNDVLVGDVWICSGQSNMEFGIGNANNAAAEIAGATDDQIRLCLLPRQISLEPQPVDPANWVRCSPANVAQGGWNGFSAVGYFFGRELRKRLNIPIGLVGTYWGGTIAESWTSREGLSHLADFQPTLARIAGLKQNSGVPYEKQLADWFSRNDPGSLPGKPWQAPDFADSDWKDQPMPTSFEDSGLAKFDGTVWYRREIDLPNPLPDGAATLSLGAIDDMDTTWVNGVLVGSNGVYNYLRKYAVPAGVLKPGRNVVTVRVLDTGGLGGFYSSADLLYLDFAGQKISLAGTWKSKIGVDLTKATPVPQAVSDNPNFPTLLYNGMINPLVPLAIKGAIWYQGESNADRAYQYRALLPAMIEDWRDHWHQGDFPFLIVQLANFLAPAAQPGDDNWAELREAQTMTADKVRNAGIALAIDVGDANDIHPKNKQDVGFRLALAALHVAYGQKLEYAGPTYRSMRRDGAGIRIMLSHAEGLKTKGGPVTGFAIAGADHKFHWADATIDGETVLVHSDAVPDPVAVRYAWSTNPAASLYNSADLPANPFRTDDWPGITVGRK